MGCFFLFWSFVLSDPGRGQAADLDLRLLGQVLIDPGAVVDNRGAAGGRPAVGAGAGVAARARATPTLLGCVQRRVATRGVARATEDSSVCAGALVAADRVSAVHAGAHGSTVGGVATGGRGCGAPIGGRAACRGTSRVGAGRVGVVVLLVAAGRRGAGLGVAAVSPTAVAADRLGLAAGTAGRRVAASRSTGSRRAATRTCFRVAAVATVP